MRWHASAADMFGSFVRLVVVATIGTGLVVSGSACGVQAREEASAAPGRWELRGPSGTIGGPFTTFAEGLPYGDKQLTLTGRLTIWYSSGQAALAVDVKNGAPTGTFTVWHKNGAKLAEGEFRDGIPWGAFTVWDPQGRRRLVMEFFEVSELGPEDTNVKSMTMWDEQGRVIEPTTEDIYRLEDIEYFFWVTGFAHDWQVQRNYSRGRQR